MGCSRSVQQEVSLLSLRKTSREANFHTDKENLLMKLSLGPQLSFFFSHLRMLWLYLMVLFCGLMAEGAPIPLFYASSVKILFPYLTQDKSECFQKDLLSRNWSERKSYKVREQSLSCPEAYPSRVEVLLSIDYLSIGWSSFLGTLPWFLLPHSALSGLDARKRSSDFQPEVGFGWKFS